jgi:hypothetical protein
MFMDGDKVQDEGVVEKASEEVVEETSEEVATEETPQA